MRDPDKVIPLSQTLTMKTVGTSVPTRAPMTSTELWSVTCSGVTGAPAQVIRPSLGFRHSNTYKAISGVFFEYKLGVFSGQTVTFDIQTGSDTLRANIPTLTSIAFTPSDAPKVTVTAPNGRVTSGSLIFLKDGTAVVVNNWFLMGVLPNSGGVVALLERPSCSLSKSSAPRK